jgi:2-keto-4-pentenoate hydratase
MCSTSLKPLGWLIIAACGLSSAILGAACPNDEAVAAYVQDFAAGRASRGFGRELTLEDAECAKLKLIAALPEVAGPVIGYKAAFMSQEVQKRFGLSAPAWGVMFGKMMLETGAQLPAQFGALPLYEADFVVLVKDAGLAHANTPREALRHISSVVPFIELLDVMLEGSPSGIEFVATNSAYRGGVLGPRIEVQVTQAFLDSLASMTVVMTEDQSGAEIGRATGSAMNGNPINSAMWLAQALDSAGITHPSVT